MAKSLVEKAPVSFDINNFSNIILTIDPQYLTCYKETDDKGRYLYWDQFKWRVDKNRDAKKAWIVTKLVRFTKQKEILLYDLNSVTFHFLYP